METLDSRSTRLRRSRSVRLQKIKASRDAARRARRWPRIERLAATKTNLMPMLLEAAEARCTVGEIVNALADVFGRYDGAAKW